MLTNNKIRSDVRQQGLGNAVFNGGYNESNIEDRKLAELWAIAREALEEVGDYLFPTHGYTE